MNFGTLACERPRVITGLRRTMVDHRSEGAPAIGADVACVSGPPGTRVAELDQVTMSPARSCPCRIAAECSTDYMPWNLGLAVPQTRPARYQANMSTTSTTGPEHVWPCHSAHAHATPAGRQWSWGLAAIVAVVLDSMTGHVSWKTCSCVETTTSHRQHTYRSLWCPARPFVVVPGPSGARPKWCLADVVPGPSDAWSLWCLGMRAAPGHDAAIEAIGLCHHSPRNLDEPSAIRSLANTTTTITITTTTTTTTTTAIQQRRQRQ